MLEKAIVGILGAFGQITLPEGLQPQFIEDGNSAHGSSQLIMSVLYGGETMALPCFRILLRALT